MYFNYNYDFLVKLYNYGCNDIYNWWFDWSSFLDAMVANQSKKPVEFYNFLQVDMDSNKSENIDQDSDQSNPHDSDNKKESRVPFFDFLSVKNSTS